LSREAYLPDASAAWVVEDSTRAEHPMELIHREGFFEAVFPGHQEVFAYWLKKAHPDGSSALFHDSYSFLPTLTEYDLYLFNGGNHHQIYEKLGAHHSIVNGVGGVQFAVWAPSARSVSVIGTSTDGTAGTMPCACSAPPVSGRSSSGHERGGAV